MSGYKYAHDKPEDCRNCFFYDQCRSKCRLGQMNCYYLIAVDEKEDFPCDTCPYHREEAPCIGFCMAKIVAEWREGRRKPKYAVAAEKKPEQIKGRVLCGCAAS